MDKHVLVPREPTLDMRLAFTKAWLEITMPVRSAEERFTQAYKAMLAAAPKPDVDAVERVREACAKVCDALGENNKGYEGAIGTPADWSLETNAMKYCAIAIRALDLAALTKDKP